MSVWSILFRSGLAVLIGTAIGIEREHKSRPAGMRTHVLVCLGACIIAMIECQIEARVMLLDNPHVNITFGRVIAQVVSGIGFLGAGTIFMSDRRVSGLTTAASLWNVACLGIAVGLGYWVIAVIGCAFVLIVLLALARIVRINPIKRVEIRFIHRKETMDFLNQYMETHGILVKDLDFHVDNHLPENVYTHSYVLRLPKNMTYTDVVQALSEYPNILHIMTMNT